MSNYHSEFVESLGGPADLLQVRWGRTAHIPAGYVTLTIDVDLTRLSEDEAKGLLEIRAAFERLRALAGGES